MRFRYRAPVAAALIATWLLPSAVTAQEASADQIELNRKAVEAMSNEDYERAVTLFSALLNLSKVNIIYLNYGRALTKAGRCEEAAKAFDTVPTAQAVDNPPKEAVMAKLEEYRGFMASECPGNLKITCDPGDIQIVIDGGDAAMCKESYSLMPGAHTIVGMRGDEKTEHQVSITTDTTSELSFKFGADTPVKVVKAAPEPGSNTTALVLLGVGGGLVATGLLVDATVVAGGIDDLKEARDNGDVKAFDDLEPDVETQQSAVILMVAGGVLTAGIGAILYLASGSDDGDAEAAVQDLKVAPWVGESSAGVAGGFRF